MTLKRFFHYPKNMILSMGAFALLIGFPLVGFPMGYGQGDVHHGTPHASPHAFPHHASGKFGHGTSPHGAGIPGGHGMSSGHMDSGHGPHQSASKFIEHILKFKDGMAITDDQVAKLQSIKTDFEKTKIKMKADMQLTSLDLHELLRDDKGELGAVEAKLKSLYELRASMYLASVKAGRDAKSVLTDEQRARMKTVHDRINAYKDGGMGKGHPGGYNPHSKEKDS
ncbi:MAG: Spy/CpxP family protein refolding chaperone [Nitrospirales bacterium]